MKAILENNFKKCFFTSVYSSIFSLILNPHQPLIHSLSVDPHFSVSLLEASFSASPGSPLGFSQ